MSNLQGGRWCLNFDTYTKDSHLSLGSRIMVFLGILDFSNGEGGSSVGEGSSSIGESSSSVGESSPYVGEGVSSVDGR